MYKAKRAIIMAAGFGSRLKPLTLDTPKPLIQVNGKKIISTIIDALHYNGIDEIYVVVGYMKEKFRILEKEYRNIKLIENPYYDKANNISSLYVARNYIEEAIILDGDQIIYNNEILNPNFYKSSYCGSWVDKTDEWLLKVKNNNIIECLRNGGDNGYRLYSISFWSREDGKKLKKHLEKEFIKNKNINIYWDDVAMFCYKDKYSLAIREVKNNDLVEIDNLKELIEVDDSYNIILNKEVKEYED